GSHRTSGDQSPAVALRESYRPNYLSREALQSGRLADIERAEEPFGRVQQLSEREAGRVWRRDEEPVGRSNGFRREKQKLEWKKREQRCSRTADKMSALQHGHSSPSRERDGTARARGGDETFLRCSCWLETGAEARDC